MKSFSRLSAGVFLAGVLCFAPGAFGQGSSRHQAASGFLAFSIAPHSNHHRAADHDGGGNGCGNQGGGGWGWDGDGWGGGGNGGGCTPVPEGGTALAYLSIAGFCCLGAAIARSRRPVGASEAN
jgi:hypothetical protein